MKKNFIKYAALSCAALIALASCVKDYDKVEPDTATRVSLSPAVENFVADGKTASGADSYKAAVIVNQGSFPSELTWTASVAGATYAEVKEIELTEDFKETFSGTEYDIVHKGIELTVAHNSEYKRTFTLNIEVEDGTVVPFTFSQLGDKADAAVTTDVKEVEFLSAGGDYTVAYTTNMGDVYKYELVPAEASSWLSFEKSTKAGEVILTAQENTDKQNGRQATLKITVGTAETSMAVLEIPVEQLPQDDFYFMYGPSAKKLSIENSLQLTKDDVGVYSGKCFFLNSENGKNTVMFNLNSRTLEYPCFALAKGGKVVKMNSAADLPAQGPEIDVDGLRALTVDFNTLTWVWQRVSTQNACPDSEVANYPTKDYVAKDGTVKTWMTTGLHWDGGPNIGPLKLGSGLVAGNQTGGYGNTGSEPLAQRNFDFDTEENGGKVPEVVVNGKPLAETKGRLYSGYEVITGEPTGCFAYLDLHPFLEEPWIDAMGNTIPVGNVRNSGLAGLSDADAEEKYPQIAAQMQGICPYGWHVANLQDWKDLIYSVAQLSKGGDYEVDPANASYNAISSQHIANVAANLYDQDYVTYCPGVKRSNKADAVGFNLFCQGWRLRRTGYDYGPGDDKPRFYAMIPMRGNYSDTKMAAWRAYTNGQGVTDFSINDGFDFGNGCGAAVRCVKDYVR